MDKLPREIYFHIFKFMYFDDILKLQLLNNFHIYNCILYFKNIKYNHIKSKYKKIIESLIEYDHNNDNNDCVNCMIDRNIPFKIECDNCFNANGYSNNTYCVICEISNCKICDAQYCEDCIKDELTCKICHKITDICIRCQIFINMLKPKCDTCIKVLYKKYNLKYISRSDCKPSHFIETEITNIKIHDLMIHCDNCPKYNLCSQCAITNICIDCYHNICILNKCIKCNNIKSTMNSYCFICDYKNPCKNCLKIKKIKNDKNISQKLFDIHYSNLEYDSYFNSEQEPDFEKIFN